MHMRILKLAAAALALAACADQETAGPLTGPIDGTPGFSSNASEPGAVYALTNTTSANAVVRYARGSDGTLGPATSFTTGGTGSGAGLGSQGALAFSRNDRWLFAVNAGSNDVSVFRVEEDELRLVERAPSGGVLPISVTTHGRLVYVLNAGGSGNISGFELSPKGTLTPIAGSTQPLSGAGAGPAQISFSPDGDWLVVTEKNTNRILTYPVDASGVAGAPIVHPSAGVTPFGFTFGKRNVLLVSEAFGGAPNASATSSYHLSDGALQVITPSAPTTETAACWAVLSRDGRYVYVTNTGSGSVTGYAVATDGSISLLDADGVTGVTGGAPIDADISVNGRFLYALNGGGFISAFAVASDGGLSAIDTVMGLPASSSGLVAH